MKLLENHKIKDVKKVYLTASGGPFLNYKISKLKKVKPYQALNILSGRWEKKFQSTQQH